MFLFFSVSETHRLLFALLAAALPGRVTVSHRLALWDGGIWSYNMGGEGVSGIPHSWGGGGRDDRVPAVWPGKLCWRGRFTALNKYSLELFNQKCLPLVYGWDHRIPPGELCWGGIPFLFKQTAANCFPAKVCPSINIFNANNYRWQRLHHV